MRLRDIQTLIDKHIDSINLSHNNISGDNQNFKLINIFETVSALKSIEPAGIFTKQFKTIKTFESFYISSSDETTVPRNVAQQAIKAVKDLKQDLIVFKIGISEVLPDQSEFSISIKLPKSINLKDVSEAIDKLDKILSQSLLNKFVAGKVSVQNFDTGSEWVEILLNSGKAVSVVASIVYAAIYLKREDIKNKELLEVVRNRRITNDMLENLGNQLKDKLDEQLKEQILLITKEAGAPIKDKEYQERIKHCIKETSELIDKGLKFFPASKSPNELISKFPDFSKTNIEDMIEKRKELPEETS